MRFAWLLHVFGVFVNLELTDTGCNAKWLECPLLVTLQNRISIYTTWDRLNA